MTAEPDLTAMSLALASAKKACERCSGTGWDKVKTDHWVACYDCKIPDAIATKGTGEVYVLGPEVRVECEVNHVSIKRKELSPGNSVDIITNPNCIEAGCRGWNPLDPRYLGDWMVALAEAGIRITVQHTWTIKQPGTLLEWAATTVGYQEFGSTPELTFFQAAMKALSLPKVFETQASP